jgi:hypothetical protein
MYQQRQRAAKKAIEANIAVQTAPADHRKHLETGGSMLQWYRLIGFAHDNRRHFAQRIY